MSKFFTWPRAIAAAAVVCVASLTLALGCSKSSPQTTPPTVETVDPVLVGAVPAGNPATEAQRGRRLFITHVRNKVSRELRTQGFARIGHPDQTPKTAEQIAKLHAAIDDDVIMQHAHEVGALGDGTILGRLGELWKWIQAHEDQIAAVIKFVLGLMAILGV